MNLTTLEAVNRMLRGSRQRPVSALGGSSEDGLLAEQILDEVLRREQMQGLHVNTTLAEFTPDGDTRIILPNNTLQIRGVLEHTNRNLFVKEVDGELRLFDAAETPATDLFPDDDTINLEIVQSLGFEELPGPVRFSIVDQAAVELQMVVQGSTAMDQHLKAIAARSRALARAYDMRSRPHNQFNDGRSEGPRAGARYTPRPWP